MERGSNHAGSAVATLAGGCFWCLEAVYSRLQGVEGVESGYMGGHHPDPSYEVVCSGQSGHAEVVQVRFDPQVVSYRDLLKVFFAIHDPTTADRQGNDVGTQYRSVIFYHSPEQKAEADAFIRTLTEGKVFAAPIVTEVVPAVQFHVAERYHHAYFENNRNQPYCQFVVAPKVEKLRKKFAALLKKGLT